MTPFTFRCRFILSLNFNSLFWEWQGVIGGWLVTWAIIYHIYKRIPNKINKTIEFASHKIIQKLLCGVVWSKDSCTSAVWLDWSLATSSSIPSWLINKMSLSPLLDGGIGITTLEAGFRVFRILGSAIYTKLHKLSFRCFTPLFLTIDWGYTADTANTQFKYD